MPLDFKGKTGDGGNMPPEGTERPQSGVLAAFLAGIAVVLSLGGLATVLVLGIAGKNHGSGKNKVEITCDSAIYKADLSWNQGRNLSIK